MRARALTLVSVAAAESRRVPRLVMFYDAAHKRLPFANDFSKRHFGIRKKGCKTMKVNNQTLNETQRLY
jgi:hypothetical protein